MLLVVSQREQFKIYVVPAAKEAVEKFCETYGQKEIWVASRLYEWFGRLPLPVQKWIVGLTDASEGEGMRLFAESLLEGVEGERPPDIRIGSTGPEQRPGASQPPPAPPPAPRRNHASGRGRSGRPK